jgi:polyisoprenoid-binding protein YceI
MTTTQATTTYTIDPVHSSVEFSVRHLMLSKVRGAFRGIAGTVVLPAGGLVPTAVTAEIAVDSIDTRDPQRDGHLKSPDFFHAEKFTHIRFASTAVTSTGSETFDIAGTLEILGVSLPVTLKAEAVGRTTDPWGNDRVGYEAKTRINRKDYGLSYNQALETGGVMIGENIDIELQIEAFAKPAA